MNSILFFNFNQDYLLGTPDYFGIYVSQLTVDGIPRFSHALAPADYGCFVAHRAIWKIVAAAQTEWHMVVEVVTAAAVCL